MHSCCFLAKENVNTRNFIMRDFIGFVDSKNIMDDVWPSMYPHIITNRMIGDGEFGVPGNTILGFDLSGNQLISFHLFKIENGLFCSLMIWNFNPVDCSLTGPLRQYPLFTQNGRINSHASTSGFCIKLLQLPNIGIKYIVFGYNKFDIDHFVYLTLIFDETKIFHYGFPSNSSNFSWDFESSLIISPLSIVVNCISTIKILIFHNDGTVRNFQFDIEKHLNVCLKEHMRCLEHYQTEIIGKNENNKCVFIFIGFYFYNEQKGKWFLVYQIVEVYVNGNPIRQAFQKVEVFDTRPQGKQMEETLNSKCAEFKLLAKEQNIKNYVLLTNENQKGTDIEGIRMIKAPHFNLIIADDTNGIINLD